MPNDLSSSPVVIYITVAAGLAVLIAGQLPKVAKSWTDFLAERRRTAVDKDDADIVELRRQVKNLSDQLADHAARMGPHLLWDRRVYAALVKLGEDIDPPPPLF